MLYLLWLFDRITPLYTCIQHTAPLIPFVNESHKTPHHIHGLNPHVILTIIIRPWSYRSWYYLHYVFQYSGTNQLQGCTIKPTTTYLPSIFILFKCSHWNKSSVMALMEKNHSERWWSAEKALCRAIAIAQLIPSLLEIVDETHEREGNRLCLVCRLTHTFTGLWDKTFYYLDSTLSIYLSVCVLHDSLFRKCWGHGTLQERLFDWRPESIAPSVTACPAIHCLY